MALAWPYKDPDEILDYALDWTARVSPDTIIDSTWIVPDGLTVLSDSSSNVETIVWLSGGTAGTTYVLTNRILTAAGRTMDQSVKLKLKEK